MLKLTETKIINNKNLTGEFEKFQNSETYKHTERVAYHSHIIAKKLGMTEKESQRIFDIAPYHDFGKMVIDENILYKESQLTDEEFNIIKSHATLGYEILKDNNHDFFDECAIVAHQHHEKWNGTGYPNNLKGEDIHISSRIVAVADVLDALISKRAYKKAWSPKEIILHFEKEKNVSFDPIVAKTVIENFSEFNHQNQKLHHLQTLTNI